MKRLIVLLGSLTLFTACEVKANDFYQWTTKDGVVSATDSQKRIPPQYRNSAIKRNFAELEKTSNRSYASVSPTKMPPSVEADQVRIVVANPEIPSKVCLGKVNVIKERRQIGEYNRTFYTVIDECGTVVYDSPISPRLNLER